MMNRLLQSLMNRFYRPLLTQYLAKERTYAYDGLKLIIPPTVFHPAFFGSSKVFLRFLDQQQLEGKKLLEIGSGSGILSLLAARKGAMVTAVDINPSAVEATRQNARHNRLQVTAHHSDLFDDLPAQTFDIIIANPPFFKGKPEGAAGYAWYAGPEWQFFDRFFREIDPFLHPDSQVWMILSEKCDLQIIKIIAWKNGKDFVSVYEERRLFERFMIFKI